MKILDILLMTILVLSSSNVIAADCGNSIILPSSGASNPNTNPDPPSNITPSAFPDFILKKHWLVNSLGQESYIYSQTDSVTMHSDSKNVGQADWAKFSGETEADDIYVKFYLSSGYKEDSHDEWRCVGTEQIQKGNLDVGETKHESATLNLGTINNGNPLTPGVYNIVACVDRKYDQDNGDGEVPEMHKSNNCSTEAAFTVTEPNYQPQGWVDGGIYCSIVSGWARDNNTPLPIDVHVFEANSGWIPMTHIATIKADIYRSDVGSHGFTYTIPNNLKDGTTRYLLFFAVNFPQGANPVLMDGFESFNCSAPEPMAPTGLRILAY